MKRPPVLRTGPAVLSVIVMAGRTGVADCRVASLLAVTAGRDLFGPARGSSCPGHCEEARRADAAIRVPRPGAVSAIQRTGLLTAVIARRPGGPTRQSASPSPKGGLCDSTHALTRFHAAGVCGRDTFPAWCARSTPCTRGRSWAFCPL